MQDGVKVRNNGGLVILVCAHLFGTNLVLEVQRIELSFHLASYLKDRLILILRVEFHFLKT